MPTTTELPEYVRLTAHMVYGCAVDVDVTGWGVTGRDVRHVPAEDEYASAPAVREFIRDRIQRGVFEPADKADWDLVHKVDVAAEGDTPRIVMVTDDRVPENKLRQSLAGAAAEFEQDVAAREAATEGDEFANMTDDQLKDQLSTRGLATTGTHNQLASRLRTRVEKEQAEDSSGDQGGS